MIFNATLRLETDAQAINYASPWATGTSIKLSATVTVISYEGKTFLVTNAHAVENATYLKVKLDQGSIDLPVKVVWFDGVIDLALLEGATPEAKAVLEKKTNPLMIAPLFQKRGTEVNAYGYPAGGRTLSFTKGHISRTEISILAFSGLAGLLVQTSAPINTGSSGGPITVLNPGLKSECCVGIVSQKSANAGYFIPASTVIQTLQAYNKYGKLRQRGLISQVTVPHLSFNFQSLQNRFLRSELGMEAQPLGAELYGIYVTRVPKSSCAHGHLEKGDIIHKIDGHRIQTNGNVQVDELEDPVNFLYLIQRKNYLDEVIVDILRRKDPKEPLEPMSIRIRLTKQLGQSLLGYKQEKLMKYHIHPSGSEGAFVFVTVTTSLIHAFSRPSKSGLINQPPMLSNLGTLEYNESLREIVALKQILASEASEGFETFALSQGTGCEADRIIEANGQPINKLQDLVTALELHQGKVSMIKFANGTIMAMPPEIPVLTRQKLKERYQIAHFSSPSLFPIDERVIPIGIKQLNYLGDGNINPSSFFGSQQEYKARHPAATGAAVSLELLQADSAAASAEPVEFKT